MMTLLVFSVACILSFLENNTHIIQNMFMTMKTFSMNMKFSMTIICISMNRLQYFTHV